NGLGRGSGSQRLRRNGSADYYLPIQNPANTRSKTSSRSVTPISTIKASAVSRSDDAARTGSPLASASLARASASNASATPSRCRALVSNGSLEEVKPVDIPPKRRRARSTRSSSTPSPVSAETARSHAKSPEPRSDLVATRTPVETNVNDGSFFCEYGGTQKTTRSASA